MGIGSTGGRICSPFPLPNPCLLWLSASPALGDLFVRAGGGFWITFHSAWSSSSSPLGPSKHPFPSTASPYNHFAVSSGNVLPQAIKHKWEIIVYVQFRRKLGAHSGLSMVFPSSWHSVCKPGCKGQGQESYPGKKALTWLLNISSVTHMTNCCL